MKAIDLIIKNEDILQRKQLFIQKVCEKHEWAEVILTPTGILNTGRTYSQCRLCGKLKK